LSRPIYLDCNATTPIEPRVAAIMMRFLTEEFGNAGSRTHIYGAEAARAVNRAREQVAAVTGDESSSVIFTSGATESNNLATFGLRKFGEASKRKHIISTQIEHKAVLEPIEYLRDVYGFEVTLVAPTQKGCVDPEEIGKVLRPDTLLVSVMHVNNETGVIQPLDDISERLAGHDAYFHTDASQGFGKDLRPLRNSRIDMISLSGHKIYGPKGVGALIARKRRFARPPLEALAFGGGQERGLRPGTLPVALIAALGLSAELAVAENKTRLQSWADFKVELMKELAPLSPHINGEQGRVVPTTVNLSFDGLDSEAVMLALKELVAISNGSACTSEGHQPSHVLVAMGLTSDRVRNAVRWSWSHMTPEPDWHSIREALRKLRL